MVKRRLNQGELDSDKGSKEVENGSDDDQPVDVKPIGEAIKRSIKGKAEFKHYEAFELDSVQYDLEDSVLVSPEQRGEKPYVAIIKEIKLAEDGSIAVTGQWFYRPEEAEKKGGGSWVPTDSRELFYSFHRDEVPAEAVMHKCVVHFIPPQKQAPLRTKHPGFIVRQVYDTVEKKLWKLTDKDYEDTKQQEIDLLVQRTQQLLGDLPNVEADEAIADQEETEKSTRPRRRAIPALYVLREESSEPLGKVDTPTTAKNATPLSGGHTEKGFPSDIQVLLEVHNALTGQTARDRWLEKLTRTVKNLLETVKPKENASVNQEPNSVPKKGQSKTGELRNDVPQSTNREMVGVAQAWPEAAIAAVIALEKVAHDYLGSDAHNKYNIKMRQLDFNLKNSPILAQRLISKELDPSVVLHMTPVELKDGLTATEKKAREPPEVEKLQMADTRCTICGEREVSVKDIIQVGFSDRYQLECLKCGNSWYASRDSISSLTIETVSPSPIVGTAPWATSKFDDLEKELASPSGDKVGVGQEAPLSDDKDKQKRVPITTSQKVDDILSKT